MLKYYFRGMHMPWHDRSFCQWCQMSYALWTMPSSSLPICQASPATTYPPRMGMDAVHSSFPNRTSIVHRVHSHLLEHSVIKRVEAGPVQQHSCT